MNRAREIDRLIASHLFGLDAAEREVVVGGRGWPGEGLWHPGALPVHGPKHLVRRLVVPGGPRDYVEVDHYSTTHVGMGQVIDAMLERGAEFQLSASGGEGLGHPILGSRIRWLAIFRLTISDETDRSRGWRSGVADTAPMAVALAALAALGVDET